MSETPDSRRLSAVFFSDIVGYSRLMGDAGAPKDAGPNLLRLDAAHH